MSRKLENGFGEETDTNKEKVIEKFRYQFSDGQSTMIDLDSIQKDTDYCLFVKNFKLLLLLRYAKSVRFSLYTLFCYLFHNLLLDCPSSHMVLANVEKFLS